MSIFANLPDNLLHGLAAPSRDRRVLWELASPTGSSPSRSSTHTVLLARNLRMTIGMIFYLLAAIVLFLAGIGVRAIPNPENWGLFCIALGLLLDEYDLGFRRRR